MSGRYVDPSEYILTTTYRELVSEIGDPRLIWAQTDEIHWENMPSQKCVVVSGNSDAGIHKQADSHPNTDIQKCFWGVDWPKISDYRDGYGRVELGPTVTERCDPFHKYVVKMDRFSWWTFNELPDQVVNWFSANLNIVHPRLAFLPFGLNDHGHGKTIMGDFVGRPKKGLLYVNFQKNTVERISLLEHFRGQSWVTFRECNLPVDQYYAEMSEHQFVLSPFGNGLDCYRNLEALYLGTVPIMPEGLFGRYWLDANLPVLLCRNMIGLNESSLSGYYPGIHAWDNEVIKKSYYRKLFEEALLHV